MRPHRGTDLDQLAGTLLLVFAGLAFIAMPFAPEQGACLAVDATALASVGLAGAAALAGRRAFVLVAAVLLIGAAVLDFARDLATEGHGFPGIYALTVGLVLIARSAGLFQGAQ